MEAINYTYHFPSLYHRNSAAQQAGKNNNTKLSNWTDCLKVSKKSANASTSAPNAKERTWKCIDFQKRQIATNQSTSLGEIRNEAPFCFTIIFFPAFDERPDRSPWVFCYPSLFSPWWPRQLSVLLSTLRNIIKKRTFIFGRLDYLEIAQPLRHNARHKDCYEKIHTKTEKHKHVEKHSRWLYIYLELDLRAGEGIHTHELSPRIANIALLECVRSFDSCTFTPKEVWNRFVYCIKMDSKYKVCRRSTIWLSGNRCKLTFRLPSNCPYNIFQK